MSKLLRTQWLNPKNLLYALLWIWSSATSSSTLTFSIESSSEQLNKISINFTCVKIRFTKCTDQTHATTNSNGGADSDFSFPEEKLGQDSRSPFGFSFKYFCQASRLFSLQNSSQSLKKYQEIPLKESSKKAQGFFPTQVDLKTIESWTVW